VIRTSASALALATLCTCKTVPDEPRPAPSAAVNVGHVQLAEAPASGDVDAVVRDALAKSSAQKRRLVVYVGATWCEPCRRFHEAAARGELDATFPDLDMLGFDLDRDNERLAAAGYVSKYIPLFALPKADGTSSGKQIEGGIKGEGAVAYITPKLQTLLAE
jgi:thiol-disulfide isomerase/thioredoxin